MVFQWKCASCLSRQWFSPIIEEWCKPGFSARHNVADLWILVWSKVGGAIDEGFNISVVWAKAHTTLDVNTTP